MKWWVCRNKYRVIVLANDSWRVLKAFKNWVPLTFPPTADRAYDAHEIMTGAVNLTSLAHFKKTLFGQQIGLDGLISQGPFHHVTINHPSRIKQGNSHSNWKSASLTSKSSLSMLDCYRVVFHQNVGSLKIEHQQNLGSLGRGNFHPWVKRHGLLNWEQNPRRKMWRFTTRFPQVLAAKSCCPCWLEVPLPVDYPHESWKYPYLIMKLIETGWLIGQYSVNIFFYNKTGRLVTPHIKQPMRFFSSQDDFCVASSSTATALEIWKNWSREGEELRPWDYCLRAYI